MSFCEITGLTVAQVKDYEERGLIRSTAKGGNQFYSYSEAYRAKGIMYFMKTQGLSPEEAFTKINEQAKAANQRS